MNAEVIHGDALEVLPAGTTDIRIPPRDKRGWAKGIVSWRFEGWWCQSVPFTWLLPAAARFAMLHEPCIVGGPAAKLMPEYIGQWAEIAEEEYPEALQPYQCYAMHYHRPIYTSHHLSSLHMHH